MEGRFSGDPYKNYVNMPVAINWAVYIRAPDSWKQSCSIVCTRAVKGL